MLLYALYSKPSLSFALVPLLPLRGCDVALLRRTNNVPATQRVWTKGSQLCMIT